MLEKIGLPPKPSLRGNTWVVDASHCQGCSSQFTFINRKHHCRRCGGIFCGSCTQQRMVLRGQGDSPVRICEPCKKLEEAARFETRYGHKNRGGFKQASKREDEILSQILGNDASTQKASASCSNISEEATQVEGGNTVRSLSLDQPTDMLTEVGSATPEDLRQQALAEKQKYKTLKAEGKSEEALKAFKRGKELERQAGALELSLRKNRKRALSLSSSSVDDTQIKDELKASSRKITAPSLKGKEPDDLSAELKELGWSDLDLHAAEKKPATLSLEGELSSLLREVSQKSNKEKRAVTTDKSGVLAHKKKALELKRAGNLAEAKEELKKAKVLERKIEEEELLGESDESDDELSSLIRSMDAVEHDGISGRNKSDLDFDFNRLINIGDDIPLDGNFDITDDDMDDPEISSALKSLGWEEDDNAPSQDFNKQAKRESSVAEIQSLKREALSQKRAGNTAEALALLKKAKLLEAELESSDVLGTESDVYKKDTVLEPVKDTPFSTRASTNVAGPLKSKLVIQKELIALKKKALSLRREGKIDESDEELRKAKVLEEQLEDMNKAPPVTQPSVSNRQSYGTYSAPDNGDEEEVTDQDMQDPAYLSLLKNLGWEDGDKAEAQTSMKESQSYVSDSSTVRSVEARTSKKSKSEIQRELLTLKRKALTLRRRGEVEEADEVLQMAQSLEAQLDEFEEPTRSNDAPQITKSSLQVDPHDNRAKDSTRSNDAPQISKASLQVDPHNNRAKNSEMQTKDKISLEKPEEIEKPHDVHVSKATVSQPPLQQEVLAHKRKALAFKRDGKLAEAKEELRKAKLLEKQMEETSQTTTNSSDAASSSSVDKEASPSSVSKPPLSSRERFKLQQKSLGHKRQALKLRREGRTEEADAEFELAKAIESQLQEFDPPPESSGPADDVKVEDFLDPQLLAALQVIGLGDGQTKSEGIERPESTQVDEDVNTERELLLERIKSEKVKAVNLKRSGKQGDALDALRRAKLYEKKLQSLS